MKIKREQRMLIKDMITNEKDHGIPTHALNAYAVFLKANL
jgi:hypothetical protein